MDAKQHWESVYGTKAANEVSWFQPEPTLSLTVTPVLSLGDQLRTACPGRSSSIKRFWRNWTS
jgi:hypothetical protein